MYSSCLDFHGRVYDSLLKCKAVHFYFHAFNVDSTFYVAFIFIEKIA